VIDRTDPAFEGVRFRTTHRPWQEVEPPSSPPEQTAVVCCKGRSWSPERLSDPRFAGASIWAVNATILEVPCDWACCCDLGSEGTEAISERILSHPPRTGLLVSTRTLFFHYRWAEWTLEEKIDCEAWDCTHIGGIGAFTSVAAIDVSARRVGPGGTVFVVGADMEDPCGKADAQERWPIERKVIDQLTASWAKEGRRIVRLPAIGGGPSISC
jgi:hypothetical protein